MAGRHRHGRGPTVTVYTVSTREFTQLGSVKAAHITWSPDGSTLAYEGGEDGPGELRLVDADGDTSWSRSSVRAPRTVEEISSSAAS